MVELVQGINDERIAVATATTHFLAVAAKSDALEDCDLTAPSKRARELTRAEDARLQAAYARLENAREPRASPAQLLLLL